MEKIIISNTKWEKQKLFDEYIKNWHEHTGESFEEILDKAIIKERAKADGVDLIVLEDKEDANDTVVND